MVPTHRGTVFCYGRNGLTIHLWEGDGFFVSVHRQGLSAQHIDVRTLAQFERDLRLLLTPEPVAT